MTWLNRINLGWFLTTTHHKNHIRTQVANGKPAEDDVEAKMAQMVCSLNNREECLACGKLDASHRTFLWPQHCTTGWWLGFSNQNEKIPHRECLGPWWILPPLTRVALRLIRMYIYLLLLSMLWCMLLCFLVNHLQYSLCVTYSDRIIRLDWKISKISKSCCSW